MHISKNYKSILYTSCAITCGHQLVPIYKVRNQNSNYKSDQEAFIQFSVFSTNNELVLLLNYPHQQLNLSTDAYHDESYELVIGGGDEHDISWLSLFDANKRLKTRVQSASTPHILSHEELRSFWIRLRYKELKSFSGVLDDTLFLEFGQGPSHMSPIMSRPVGRKFLLHHIGVKQLPGNNVNIR